MLETRGLLGLRQGEQGRQGKKNYDYCPMPNAQCPMPNAPCPMTTDY
ncbi:hypothetical protein [Nostoc sp.]